MVWREWVLVPITPGVVESYNRTESKYMSSGEGRWGGEARPARMRWPITYSKDTGDDEQGYKRQSRAGIQSVDATDVDAGMENDGGDRP